jgi:hypothetical protein
MRQRQHCSAQRRAVTHIPNSMRPINVRKWDNKREHELTNRDLEKCNKSPPDLSMFL